VLQSITVVRAKLKEQMAVVGLLQEKTMAVVNITRTALNRCAADTRAQDRMSATQVRKNIYLMKNVELNVIQDIFRPN
jgi:hypothetical protein